MCALSSTMHTLLVLEIPPPTPFNCMPYRSDPSAAAMKPSSADLLPWLFVAPPGAGTSSLKRNGRSAARRNNPLLVPPRYKDARIVCMQMRNFQGDVTTHVVYNKTGRKQRGARTTCCVCTVSLVSTRRKMKLEGHQNYSIILILPPTPF